VVHQMNVTLRDLHSGSTRKLSLQKHIICPRCAGVGGRKPPEPCPPCKGTGRQVRIQQLGPGMITQMQTTCTDCRGQGERISAKDRCKQCDGKKVVQDRKILEVTVGKGMEDGQKIVFAGEGDQEPNIEPGDIIIVLDEQEHPIFKRRDQDLVMPMKITLVEALCGFQKPIKTLDDRTIVISSIPGEIIKHEAIKCIMNEGMPHCKSPQEKGRLIIMFEVCFPTKLGLDDISVLKKILPPVPEVAVPFDAVPCSLTAYDAQKRRQRSGHGMEDEDGHGRQVQCQTS